MSRREDSVLLVSNEPSETAPLRSFLASRGFAVHVTTRAGAAQSLAFRAYGLVMTDVGLPGVDGIALTRRALQLDRETEVLPILHHGAIDELVEALRIGAVDYISTPLVPMELGRKIERYRAKGELSADETKLVAETEAMKTVVSRAATACGVDLPVFLGGELGSGRKTIARAIHRFGANRTEPFLILNLKSVPSHLLATELLGSKPESGEGKAHYGVLGAAGRGAVFLENIDALPSPVQLKLIGVLDTGKLHPEGPSLDARIYCTSDRDLDALVSQGLFQRRLHQRLDALRIEIPPLREREADIPALAAHFLRTFSEESDKAVFGVAPDALAALCHYEWPGNVRELANVIERAFVLADDAVQLSHLPPRIASVAVESYPSRPVSELDAE